MDFYDRQLLTCVEIGKAVTSTLNMDEILVTILRRLSELIKAKNWTLYMARNDRQIRYPRCPAV
jgi:hypothetical protein